VARTLTRTQVVLVVLAVLLVSVWVDVRPAYACSCVGWSTRQAFAAADAVFVGKVAERSEADEIVQIRFQVDRVYKGTVYADQVVDTVTSSASCGFEAKVGSTWVIFARAEPLRLGRQTVTRLHTNLCSGNIPGSRVPRLLGRPRSPLAGASDQIERAWRTDRAVTRTILLAGGGVLVLGAGLGTWLWLAWRSKPRA
jgi:hypothetical protein